MGRYVADAVLADGRLVEIQTGRLGKIRGKLAALLEQHLVVHDAKGRKVLYRHRSPKRGSVPSMVDELVGVAQLLAHPGFEVKVRRKDGSGPWRRRGVARVDRRVLRVAGRDGKRLLLEKADAEESATAVRESTRA